MSEEEIRLRVLELVASSGQNILRLDKDEIEAICDLCKIVKGE